MSHQPHKLLLKYNSKKPKNKKPYVFLKQTNKYQTLQIQFNISKCKIFWDYHETKPRKLGAAGWPEMNTQKRMTSFKHTHTEASNTHLLSNKPEKPRPRPCESGSCCWPAVSRAFPRLCSGGQRRRALAGRQPTWQSCAWSWKLGPRLSECKTYLALAQSSFLAQKKKMCKEVFWLFSKRLWQTREGRAEASGTGHRATSVSGFESTE